MKVIHIEDRVGPRGGEYWALRLECGHLGFVRKPRFDAATMLMPIILTGSKESERAARERRNRQRRGAPRKFKCFHCEGRKC